MLATYYALQNENTFQNIFSLSGSLPNEILEKIELKKNNTKYLIFHGKIDDVVSPNQAIETHNFLISQKIDSQIITNVLTVNGVRFSFKDGSWGLIRASSNKPSLVIVTESPTSDSRKKKIFEFIDRLLKDTGKIGKYDQKI